VRLGRNTWLESGTELTAAARFSTAPSIHLGTSIVAWLIYNVK